MEKMVDFFLERERFGSNSGKDAIPESGEDSAKGRRGGIVRGEMTFQARVKVRMVDKGGDAGAKFCRGFEGQTCFDRVVEFGEQLMNSSVGDFGE